MKASADRMVCQSRSLFLRTMALVFILAPVEIAWSYQFVPEDYEWVSWPDYCKARYVTTDAGKRSQFSQKVASEKIEYWRSMIDERAFLHLHHYCAGILWLQRAQRGWNYRPQKELLNLAIGEIGYTYERLAPDSRISTIVGSALTSALIQNGQNRAAESIMAQLIARQPKASEPYVASAVVYHRAGNLERALELLNRGEAAVSTPSAELFYIKGLVLTDLQRYPEAVEYAKLAYGLGYPLTGLRKRLEAQGLNVIEH